VYGGWLVSCKDDYETILRTFWDHVLTLAIFFSRD
jgi:hypothetical protein